MIHIETQSTAITATEYQPIPSAIESRSTRQPEWHEEPVFSLLSRHSDHIHPADLGRARKCATRAITDDSAAIDCGMLPEYLRADFLRAVIEGAYRFRSRGQKFDPKRNYMPVQGLASSSIINPCRI